MCTVLSRNRRDPSSQPRSKDRAYKPMVKSHGGKRESDGAVVPEIAGRNPAGGKGPDFGHAGRAATREGMTGTAPSNYPEGKHLPPAKVRRLQNRLWAAAKQSPGRRFHALYDRIFRDDVLGEAWERRPGDCLAAAHSRFCSRRTLAGGRCFPSG